jgi:PmbA protein
MERLLETAKKVCDEAEVYSVDYRSDGISFEDGKLKDIESGMQSGVSLRILKNNCLGFAYTKNLRDREELVQNALDSLKGEVEASFKFPFTKELPNLGTYDTAIESLSNSAMVEECARVCEFLSGRTRGQLNVSAYRSVRSLRIMNSAGTDLSQKSSSYSLSPQIVYPYTSASLYRSFTSKCFEKYSDEYLKFLADMYNNSREEVRPEGGKMKVLFMPETSYVFLWRLQTATSGQSLYEHISPLEGRINEKIFDEKLTIYSDPLNDALPSARAFDDEGTPCSRFPVIEKGVLKNFYYDLHFASKMKALPTGHGFRGSMTGKPVPSLSFLCIQQGNKTFTELVKSIDRGIIVAGAMGAHSGNIPNGDFSIGVAPGIYIENGEIAGHVKNTMVAGNIYDILKRVVEIEKGIPYSYAGSRPAVLLDDISVTMKK